VGLPLAFVLGYLFAFGERWPAWPVALTAVIVLAGSELLEPRLRRADYFPFLQALVVAVSLPALAPAWGQGPVGLMAVVTAIGLLEWQARRHARSGATYLLLTGAGAGLLFVLPDGAMTASAWGLATIWLHF